MLNKFFGNTRKPEGLGGKIMVTMMNSGHAELAQWGFSHLQLPRNAQALDVGCGGGANIAQLLRLCPEGAVTGLDYSPVSVEISQKKNAAAIRAGICRVLQGSVSELPFDESTLDVVTAFETVYFWPEIENAFREILRVLKPGGRFFICNESDGEDKTGEKWTQIIDGMRIYTAEQLTVHLRAAGFSGVSTQKSSAKSWLCATAYKPV